MRNVTRRLLKVMSGTSGPIKVEYRSDPESKLGSCVVNASRQVKKTNGKHRIVSGWAITEYDKDHDRTMVLTHYWNYDPDTGTHYDTTPFRSDMEYVAHLDIGTYRKQYIGKDNDEWHQPELGFTSDKIYMLETLDIKRGNEGGWLEPISELQLEEHNLQIDYLQLIDYFETALKQRREEAA